MNTLTSTKSCACKTAGQITAYAAVLLGAQYRTHAFSILIFKDHAGLLRWDRSGAVVTAPVYYNSFATITQARKSVVTISLFALPPRSKDKQP